MTEDKQTSVPPLTPKRIIYPPLWLVIAVVAMFILNTYFPGYRYTSSVWQMVGGLVIFAGLLLLVWAGGLFKKADNDLRPFKDIKALVNSGIYRFTRNPMYLGLALILLGCALTTGALSTLLVVPAFMLVIQFRFIVYEERMLTELFGDEYRAYCKRVRRWV